MPLNTTSLRNKGDQQPRQSTLTAASYVTLTDAPGTHRARHHGRPHSPATPWAQALATRAAAHQYTGAPGTAPSLPTGPLPASRKPTVTRQLSPRAAQEAVALQEVVKQVSKGELELVP